MQGELGHFNLIASCLVPAKSQEHFLVYMENQMYILQLYVFVSSASIARSESPCLIHVPGIKFYFGNLPTFWI